MNTLMPPSDPETRKSPHVARASTPHVWSAWWMVTCAADNHNTTNQAHIVNTSLRPA